MFYIIDPSDDFVMNYVHQCYFQIISPLYNDIIEPVVKY